MNPLDVARLAVLRAHAEANRLDADLIIRISEHREPSAVGRDPRHRTFLSDGVVAILSIEDFSKVQPIPDPGPFAHRGWVRHASISHQQNAARSAGTTARGILVVNVVPTAALVREIAALLGFSPAALVFPSPDRAGPLIQHVLEDL